ncbi:MAG: polysaccharide deacetylase family protein [Bacteroidales bacterium]|nr:polysaccharide deacetylase family protein [Bacteroidales bacterium]
MSLICKAKRKLLRLWYKPLKVFFFHQVSSRFVEGKDKEYIFTSLADFERNILLLSRRYRFVSLKEAYELFQSRKVRRERYAVITFDDGYANILEALAVLQRLHIPATVFVNSKYVFERTVGVINLYTLMHSSSFVEFTDEQRQMIEQLYGQELQNNYKKNWDGLMASLSSLPQVLSDLYLTPSQLEGLDKSLFTIGMHGYEHYNSLQLSDEEFVENVERDYASLSKYANFIPFFCFPYGFARESQLQQLRDRHLVPVLCSGGDNYDTKKGVYRHCMDGVRL